MTKKSKKKERKIKAYTISNFANIGKIHNTYQVFKLYRVDAEKINLYYQKAFFRNEKIGRNDNSPISNLIAKGRWRQTIQYQVFDQIDAHQGQLKDAFVKLAFRSSLDKETIHQLCYINKAGLWQANYLQLKPAYQAKISPENLKLARHIFKHLRETHRWPTCLNWKAMKLDAKVAIISNRGGCLGQSQKKGQAKKADYWIQLSTYQAPVEIKEGEKPENKIIQIPLSTNDYFQNAPGWRSNNCQIIFPQDDDKEMTVKFIRSEIKKDKNVTNVEKYLAFDLGVSTQFATNYGDRLGQHYKKQLDYFDNTKGGIAKGLTSRNRSNQKKTLVDGIFRPYLDKQQNKRYRALDRRHTQFVKNETGRNTNKLITIHQPTILDSEALNFQGSDLSCQMNRHLHRFGQGRIEEKIKEFLFDGVIKEHRKKNAPYTSKTCNKKKCGYVDAKNRDSKDRDKFECLACGGKAHGDVNGAKSVGDGSSVSGDTRSELLAALVKTSVKNLQAKPLSQDALRSILANPYYRDYHQDFQKRLRSPREQESGNKGRLSSVEKVLPLVAPSLDGTSLSCPNRRDEHESTQSSRLGSSRPRASTTKEFS